MGQLTRFWQTLAALCLTVTAQADTLEQKAANNFVRNYASNEARLIQITKELADLPQPYRREPTGTGGFLSREQKTADNKVVLKFKWNQPVKIDAVALFPLRLFMDEIYSENLYWPGKIAIQAEISGQAKNIARSNRDRATVTQSLPKLLTFDPVTTREVVIQCSDLPKHPHQNWYAAGFAEICIFSGSDNVAPRAGCSASSSRQGYHVLAKEFLTDAQTPLGVPELSSRSENHEYVKKLGWGRRPKRPYILTVTWPHEIPMDAVRIDPAIQHAYGQSFPLRFAVELLNAQGKVVHANDSYRNFPMRTPGLNPWLTYFDEKNAKSVRLTVLAAAQPFPKVYQTIALSEITALHKGKSLNPPTVIEEQFMGKTLRVKMGAPLDSPEKQMLASASDGLTQTGSVLPLRQWTEGLARRQQLLEEQTSLHETQEKSLLNVRRMLIQGSLLLLTLVSGGAFYFVGRNHIKSQKEIRATRVKIASDLHDDVGSNLGAIILHVERLEEQLELPPEPKRLRAIYRLTRESVFGLREVLSATAPEVGRTQNLIAYMEELAGLILGKTLYTFNVSQEMSEAQLAQGLRKDLVLFYKEALHNAKRHSGCSQVKISLHLQNDSIILTVEDNGKGIDQAMLKKNRTLRTLKQRAEWLSADLHLESETGKGTQIKLTIPKE